MFGWFSKYLERRRRRKARAVKMAAESAEMAAMLTKDPPKRGGAKRGVLAVFGIRPSRSAASRAAAAEPRGVVAAVGQPVPAVAPVVVPRPAPPPAATLPMPAAPVTRWTPQEGADALPEPAAAPAPDSASAVPSMAAIPPLVPVEPLEAGMFGPPSPPAPPAQAVPAATETGSEAPAAAPARAPAVVTQAAVTQPVAEPAMAMPMMSATPIIVPAAAPRPRMFVAALGWTLRLGVILALIAGAAFVAVWPIVREGRQISVELMPISVPPDLAARGFTPEVAAVRLLDAVETMGNATLNNARNRPTKDSLGVLPQFAVTPDRLSLRSIASTLREWRGLPLRRVGGEIVSQPDGRFGMRLRVPDGTSFTDADGIAADQPEALFTEAAPWIWRRAGPLLYAWHVAETVVPEDLVRSKLVALTREVRLPPPVELRISVLYCRSLVRSGRAEEALATLGTLERREPSYPLLWHVKALAFADLGKPDEALEAQKRAVELEGSSVWSHISSASLLMRLGKPREALSDLQSARRLAPNNFDAVMLESSALLALGRATEGLGLVNRVVEARPDFPGVQEVLGNALMANNRPDLALAAYDRELARTPNSVSVRLNRANALRALRRNEEALGIVETILRSNPRDGVAVMLRGWTLLDLGRNEQALALFDGVVKEKPIDPQALFGRAMALAALGRRAEAIGAMQRVLDIQPSNRQAQAAMARLRTPPPAAGAPGAPANPPATAPAARP